MYRNVAPANRQPGRRSARTCAGWHVTRRPSWMRLGVVAMRPPGRSRRACERAVAVPAHGHRSRSHDPGTVHRPTGRYGAKRGIEQPRPRRPNLTSVPAALKYYRRRERVTSRDVALLSSNGVAAHPGCPRDNGTRLGVARRPLRPDQGTGVSGEPATGGTGISPDPTGRVARTPLPYGPTSSCCERSGRPLHARLQGGLHDGDRPSVTAQCM